MLCVTVNLSSDEWIKIANAALKQWPTEVQTLSRAEIVRRYTMFGIQALKERFAGRSVTSNTSAPGQHDRAGHAARALAA